MKAKYMRNSRIHQTLASLHLMPRNARELLKMTGWSESMGRFEESVLNPLTNDRYATRVGIMYTITAAGEEKLVEMGGVKLPLPKAAQKPYEFRRLDLGDYRKAAVRPGADDHEQCPSLVGDRRIWRDGRVEAA